jgi:beta-fructofuranosidase
MGPDGNMHIFYTGYNLSQNGKQVIIHAASSDSEGTSFTKSPEPIALSVKSKAHLASFEDIDFRDPYVLFNEEETRYWMLVATRLSKGPYWTRGCLALLTSTDLKTWHLEPEPLFAPNDMFCPECPELFTLPNGKWYLAYSRFSSPNAGTVYRLADSPRGPFRKPQDGSGGRWDGRRWYAAKSCPKAGDPAKRIYFGWIADWCDADAKWMWGGDMAFPRQLSAASDGSLRMEPVEEILRELFSSAPVLHISSFKLHALGSMRSHFFEHPSAIDSRTSCPSSYLISFQGHPSRDTASFGILIRTDSDLLGYWLRFCPVHTESGRKLYTVSLAASPSPLDDFWADQYQRYLHREVDGPELIRHDNIVIQDDESMRVLLIGDTMELFVGGRTISYRFQTKGADSKEHSRKIGIFVDDGEVIFKDLEVFSC